MAEKMKGFDLGLIWSFYNLLTLSIALLVLLDVPRPSLYEWFDLRRTVQLKWVRIGFGEQQWQSQRWVQR
jgi:cellulose synthase (UDP-forming)